MFILQCCHHKVNWCVFWVHLKPASDSQRLRQIVPNGRQKFRCPVTVEISEHKSIPLYSPHRQFHHSARPLRENETSDFTEEALNYFVAGFSLLPPTVPEKFQHSHADLWTQIAALQSVRIQRHWGIAFAAVEIAQGKEVKVKVEWIYIASVVKPLRRSGTDHTMLPAITPMPAFTS